MPETISASYITEKNKAANSPIMLYEVTIPSPASVLYLAEWDANIVYPTVGGQTYVPFPLSHEGIGINALGEIDSVRVKLSSVDRTIIRHLSTNNGLIGSKVVMKLVFADQLADSAANISATYYIDSVTTTETEAVFMLTSKLDLYEVKLPGRMFERDHCPWTYKKEGCWVWSGGAWAPAAGFSNGATECDHTRRGTAGCRFHTNTARFGGFPGIPMRGIYVI